MEIGKNGEEIITLDDLDDDVITPETTKEIDDNNLPHQDGDYISDFLKTRGIDDLEKINFQDDDGNISERSWNNLSKEEKINILNMPLETQQQVDNENDLTEEEISLLSQIRLSNMTPSEYILSMSKENVEHTPQYKIDDLSDDEVYLLDLESRVGELSEEEAAQALSTVKQNEDFFKKQIEGIRKEYKEREDLEAQQQEAELEQQQQEAFEQYQAKVVDAIDNFTSIGNFDLNFEDSDKDELAEFMLSKDASGNNYLFEALQDPETLTKAAWFILNGEEAFNTISDYFTLLIKLVSENQYKKGLEDGKKGVQTRPNVVIDNTNKEKQKSHPYLPNSIFDINLLDDDE